MKDKCHNHPDISALSLCHSCGRHFCSECLTEGSEYYYCNSPSCLSSLKSERQSVAKQAKRKGSEKALLGQDYLNALEWTQNVGQPTIRPKKKVKKKKKHIFKKAKKLVLVKPNVQKLQANKDINGLAKALRYKKDTSVAQKAAKALTKLGTPAITSLIEALEDKEKIVRRYATEALGTIGEARATEHVINMLTDKDKLVRKKAAEALGQIKDSRAANALILALKDTDETVIESVVEALVRLGKAAMTPLCRALKNKNENVRSEAAYALLLIAEPKTVNSLITALKDKGRNVREYAAEALGNIGKKDAIRPLIDLVRKEDEMQETAKDSIAKIYARELAELCIQVNQNYERMEYEEAIEAQDQLEIRIREIGETLYELGGEKLMLSAHGQVKSECAFGRYLEGAWHGVGSWLG